MHAHGPVCVGVTRKCTCTQHIVQHTTPTYAQSDAHIQNYTVEQSYLLGPVDGQPQGRIELLTRVCRRAATR